MTLYGITGATVVNELPLNMFKKIQISQASLIGFGWFNHQLNL